MRTLLFLLFLIVFVAVSDAGWITEETKVGESVEFFRDFGESKWSRRRPINGDKLEILKGTKWVDQHGKEVKSTGSRSHLEKKGYLVIDNTQKADEGNYFNNNNGKEDLTSWEEPDNAYSLTVNVK